MLRQYIMVIEFPEKTLKKDVDKELAVWYYI